MTVNVTFRAGVIIFFLFLFARLILHRRSSKIWAAEDFNLCQNMTFCLREESLVTQLKANVTLVIAPHNVNHLRGEAHAKLRDRVICDIERFHRLIAARRSSCLWCIQSFVVHPLLT